jgi:DNA-binding MarR family transcriptional regulator
MADRLEKVDVLMAAFLQLKRSMTRQMIGNDACSATPVQTEILEHISHGAERVADIAAIMQASSSAVTQHINQLVRAGFVTKTESAQDKREQLLRLTIAGRHVIEMKKQLMRSRVEQLVSELTEEELEIFINISNKIAEIKE